MHKSQLNISFYGPHFKLLPSYFFLCSIKRKGCIIVVRELIDTQTNAWIKHLNH